MIDFKICRICLRTECKVYKYDRYQLKSYYEEIAAVKINSKDGLPHYFCYECAAMLHKFHKFKEKCNIALQVLKEVKDRGTLTYDTLREVDKSVLNLSSPLNKLIVAKQTIEFITHDDLELPQFETVSFNTEEVGNIGTILGEGMSNLGVQYNSVTNRGNIDQRIDIQDFKLDHTVDLGIDYVDSEFGQSDFGVLTSPIFDKQAINKNQPETIADNIVIDPVTPNTTKTKRKSVPRKPRPNAQRKPRAKKQQTDSNAPKMIRYRKWNGEIVEVPSERIKARRRSFSEYGLRPPEPFARRLRRKVLDENLWETITLTEDQVFEELRAKAQNPPFPHQCRLCYRSFRFEDILKRHKLLVHNKNKGSKSCHFCHGRFKLDCMLRDHLVRHFSRYKCLKCQFVTSTLDHAFVHQDVHKGTIYTCSHCGKEFSHRTTYYTHLRMHRSEHVCNLCGASFVSPLGLQQHKRMIHVAEVSREEAGPLCETCDMRFETKHAYDEHLLHSSKHAATDTTGASSKKKSQKVAVVKEYKKRVRQWRKVSTCPQCDKEFPTQTACVRHQFAEHPGTSKVLCEICGATLSMNSVKAHENRHTRAVAWSCDVCARPFYTQSNLNRHRATHTREKRYKCPKCEKRFTQSNSMNLHYRTIHLKEPYPKRNRWNKKKTQEE